MNRCAGKLTRPTRLVTAVSALLLPVALGLPAITAQAVAAAPVGQGFTLIPSDLAYILSQIKIAERHSRAFQGDPSIPANPDVAGDPDYCQSMIGTGPNQIPSALTAFGLRTVDGSCNNLIAGREKYAAADQPFPRYTSPVFSSAEGAPAGFFGPGVAVPASSSYAQKKGYVFDSQPRMISNLIDDQTATNPAAVAAAGFPVRTQGNPGLFPCTIDPDPTANPPVVGVPPNCVPSHQTLFIPNVTTDVGLSPPYNSLFTFFGQFFDHGLDQTLKSGGTVFVPLKADDPLIAGPDHILVDNPATTKDESADNLPPSQQFMVLTRAQNLPGPDGILGDDPATPLVDESADDIQDASNSDSPWVDQSQTYTSHSSHQVFLREYVKNAAGFPVSTGSLLGGTALPTAMPTWADVKTQAATLLGLQLVDTDVTNVPMIAADPYGKFIPGPLRGLPQYVTKSHGLVEGNTAAPVRVPADVQYFDTPFLTDIAHNADPSAQDTDNNPATPPVFPTPDLDHVASADFANQPAGTYDDEMLNAHFGCGDGRCNENIALTAIHQVFHSEHDRLIGDIKNTLETDRSTSGVAALAQWKNLGTAGTPDGWNGERLFQAARFVTEMEYQHLVFGEFARKVQPAIQVFKAYHPDVNPAIHAEFAQAVYRFGHSMLDETVARTNVDPVTGAKSDNSIPLLTAFLNPPEYVNAGVGKPALTPEQAAGSIIMGSSDQVGNELDEFVTETLRNNLLGLPLDLATLNITRAREAGVPPLNVFRTQIFAATHDSQLKPYKSWADFGANLKHPESLINFVAAYGQHPSIVDATTLVAKRDAARAIVNPRAGDPNATPPIAADIPPVDAADFLFGKKAWASTATGLDDVDLWVGGLAEVTNVNGGLLGSTFNYVFENQLTDLQNGDRLYYLARTAGMNLNSQLEGNSFAEMIMRNTDGTDTLKADAFATAACKFQLATLSGTAAEFDLHGAMVIDDPKTVGCDESKLLQRKPDGTIQYRLINAVDPAGVNGQSVYNGTPGVDRVWGGNDSDTFWGGAGNDVIEGGGGDDVALGGDGNDIITDQAGSDILKGGPGNDAIDGGPGFDLLLGGDGQDFMNGGANDNQSFGGPGDDFIIGGLGADAVQGGAGDDWMQGGTGQDVLTGDHGAPFLDDPAQVTPGNDILIGQGGDTYVAEGGDDIMSSDAGIDIFSGAAGFDWATHQYDTVGADDDMRISIGQQLPVGVTSDRWQETEAVSGSARNDVIRGDDVVPSTVGPVGFTGCDALDQAGIDRIAGLSTLVTQAMLTTPAATIAANSATGFCPLVGNAWGQGNILLGGAGSDTIEGRGGNDIIDGDRSLRVRISVRTNPADPATQTGTTDLMEHAATSGSFGPGTAGMTLQEAVFAGLVDAGNLVSVREIVSPASGTDLGSIDVAVYSGAQSRYSVSTAPAGAAIGAPGAVTTVTDNLGPDGTDTLTNVELLRFADSVTPGAPTGVTALASMGRVAVGWAAPRLGNAAQVVTGYSVEARDTSGSVVQAFPAAGSATSLVVSGLAPATYTFWVRAANAAALTQAGPWSLPTAPVTALSAGRPRAPHGVTAVAGPAAATVSWTGANDGGSPITGFSIDVMSGTTMVKTVTGIPATATSAVVSGLTNGTTYSFVVHAISAIGTGVGSTASNLVTPVPTNGVGAIFTVQANNAIGSSTFWGLSNAVRPDATPPTVTARAPGANALLQSQLTNVTATFGEAAQPATLTTATFTLRAGAAAPVAAVVTYNATTRVATLNPTAALKAGARYTATLSKGVKDLAGNPLATTSWSFSTGPRLVLAAHSPATGATGVRRSANVTFTLNRAPVGVNGARVRLVRVSTGAAIGNVLTVSGARVTLNPGGTGPGRLSPNTQYRLVISAGIKDAAGNPLAATSWVFKTGARI
jgi:Ca2+-binding RTX toxin-like protein